MLWNILIPLHKSHVTWKDCCQSFTSSAFLQFGTCCKRTANSHSTPYCNLQPLTLVGPCYNLYTQYKESCSNNLEIKKLHCRYNYSSLQLVYNPCNTAVPNLIGSVDWHWRQRGGEGMVLHGCANGALRTLLLLARPCSQLVTDRYQSACIPISPPKHLSNFGTSVSSTLFRQFWNWEK